MPNPIKYSTGSETLALKKGNFYMGTGDVGKGPSEATGYYQGVSPSAGGYVIYMNKSGAPGDLSYHNAANDSELISFTNNLAETSFTSATQCLVYFAGQTDKVVLNRDYEGIVTDGLVLNLDAEFTPSYPRSGTTWSDVGGSNNGTLINGPTFNSADGGSIVFDGSNDLCTTTANIEAATSSNLQTYCGWAHGVGGSFFGSGADSTGKFHLILNYQSSTSIRFAQSFYGGGNQFDQTNIVTVSPNPTWNHACIVKTSILSEPSLVGVYDVYFNGVKIISNATKNATLPAPFNLGRWWNNQFVSSRISNVQIYNRALSESEILQNYNAQKGRFGL